ncbi:MAG: response regulator, partial [Gammaproteobacteria bacterium]
MRILVVEDEHDLADAIARGLRNDGYATDVAYDGEEALTKVEVNDYDLICLDLNLPGVDGRSIARSIRSGEVALPG